MKGIDSAHTMFAPQYGSRRSYCVRLNSCCRCDTLSTSASSTTSIGFLLCIELPCHHTNQENLRFSLRGLCSPLSQLPLSSPSRRVLLHRRIRKQVLLPHETAHPPAWQRQTVRLRRCWSWRRGSSRLRPSVCPPTSCSCRTAASRAEAVRSPERSCPPCWTASARGSAWTAAFSGRTGSPTSSSWRPRTSSTHSSTTRRTCQHQRSTAQHSTAHSQTRTAHGQQIRAQRR